MAFSPARTSGLALALLFFAARAAGEILWIGTFTAKGSEGIYSAEFDPATGEIGKAEVQAGADDPAFLALHPAKPVLYAIGRDTLSAYDFTADGKLALRNVVPSSGKGPCHLAVDPAGQLLATADYWSGRATIYRLEEAGNIAGGIRSIVHKGKGTHPERQNAPHPQGVYFAGDLLLVPDLGLDKIFAYRPKQGMVRAAEPAFTEVHPSDGPRHLALHPDGKHVFAIHELSNQVELFAKEGEKLTSLTRISTLPPDFKGTNTAAEIAVHPGGQWVLASNRGHDSMAVLSFAASTGELAVKEIVPCGVKVPRHFSFSPDGKWVLVAGQESNEIAVMSFDAATGKLAATGKSATVPTPTCVIFAPAKSK